MVIVDTVEYNLACHLQPSPESILSTRLISSEDYRAISGFVNTLIALDIIDDVDVIRISSSDDEQRATLVLWRSLLER